MKYVVMGAGGVGGSLACLMGLGGMDVTLIARGEHLEAMRDGIHFNHEGGRGEILVDSVKVSSSDEYAASGDRPDVLFLCTKTYSVRSAAPDILGMTDEHTLIVPLMNGIGVDDLVKEHAADRTVANGCVYIYGSKTAPGHIRMDAAIFRVVFGIDGGSDVLGEVRDELEEAGINAVYSDDIRRDTIRKFSYVSPAGGAGLYYNCGCGAMQNDGPERELFAALIQDVEDLSTAMGVHHEVSLTEANLKIMDGIGADEKTSMQRDIAAGRQSEYDNLILTPIRLGEKYGLEMPAYRKVAEYCSENLHLSAD